jgi:hypothetical protein
MAAEIVVVVENEDAGVRPPRPVEMPGREPADAAADDHKIVSLAALGDRAGLRPKVAIAQAVRDLERARMTAAQPGEDRRIVARHILRRRAGRKRRRDEIRQHRARNGAADGERNAVEEVPPRDGSVHA